MTKNASLPQSPREHRVFGLRRATISLLTVLAIVVSGLVSAPPAYAGTDDYPAVWRNAPIDSMFDTWRMYNRECTSFVAFRLSSRNGFEMPFYNDAGGWGADARARGYRVDTIPAVGAVAWWSYGHLAWVEAVNKDGTVVTEEYNWRVNGVPDGAYHRRTISASAPTGYIHFKDMGPPVSRLAGPDRFATSAAISAANFSPGVPVAYIANGNNFPDALSAAPVAAKNGAPVLLVQSDGIPAVIQAELTRLRPGRIVVLGGEASVNAEAAAQLAALTVGGVTRWWGDDRFATSAAISAANFGPGAPVVYVANGNNFPDALSAAPVAAKNGAPVLLVQADGIPAVIQAELARLRPGRIVVLGGESILQPAVATQLAALATGGVSRLSGADRFDTSAAISAANFSPGVPVVYLASGHNFPDALSGAPVAGKLGAPVLLVQSDSMPTVIRAELARLRPGRIVVLGGENSVNSAILP